jgi:hypothetical protein
MTTIKLKRSATSGNIPSSLVAGEVAINETDGMLYYRDAGGAVRACWLAPHVAECRFEYESGSSCRLNRFGGERIFINGKVEAIPSTGPSLGTGGLSNTTLYYVYAYMNGATMTLEASTSVPVTTSFATWPTKTGDASRTLVGMVYLKSGSFVYAEFGSKLVISYWNRRLLKAYGPGTAEYLLKTGSPTAVTEIDTNCRAEFLTWGDEDTLFTGGGVAYPGGANACSGTIFGFWDSTTNVYKLPGSFIWWGGTTQQNQGVFVFFTWLNYQMMLSAGYHYASLAYDISSGYTGDYGLNISGHSAAYNSANGCERTTAVAIIRG